MPSTATSTALAPKPTGWDFQVCIATTPEQLADDVSALLADGWQLHGPPFVDLQFSANGHGQQIAGNRFCQALTRPPHQASAAVSFTPVPKPVRSPRPATLRAVAAFVAVLLAGYAAADFVLFRSGLYARYVEPDSATGSFEGTFKLEKNRPPTGKREILLVGSSRMAEGFSAKSRTTTSRKTVTGSLTAPCPPPATGPSTT